MTDDLECPRCAGRNPPTARYCNGCGRMLPRPCPACGATVTAGAYRCAGCGYILPPPARGRVAGLGLGREVADLPRASPSALDGERKRVTVLFADLESSMELLARRDPEEASAVLETVIELMMDAVHLYDGTVNQVMGDGIMALFGAPMAFEDHAVRACHAALAMFAALHQRARYIVADAHLQLRVGLNSGEVVVRTVGSDLHMEYIALGETTHLAARMQQLAEPGTILLTEETRRLSEGHIEVRELGPLIVKGLPRPVEAFELLGATSVRTRWQARAVRGLTPFVGRHEELAVLTDALHGGAGGRGHTVGVVGEPGVGKSRLVWEFTHSSPARGWTVRETGCISYGVATPYLPIVELLRGYFLDGASGEGSVARDVVVERLRAIDKSLVPLAGALLALLEVGPEDPAWRSLDAAERRHRIHEAVVALLIKESRARPLILVVEDVHWADSETRALLDRLVEAISKSRLLFVATYRPEHAHRWSELAEFREVDVGPLPSALADELVEKLLGADVVLAPFRRLLVERTAGNPFFIEETVRTVTEARALGGSLEAIDVPATVHAVLAARIDRLSPRDKQLLQTAAVIGRDVPVRLLRAIVERSEEELQAGLATLQKADLLRDRPLVAEREYTFKHALVHDVAYQGLLHDLRRAIHARIVPAIERTWPDRLSEHVDRLADHAHRGELWDLALRYARQAGAKAAARSAHLEAVAWFTRALDALAHMPEDRARHEHAVDLHLSAANALLPIRELVRMGEHLDDAELQAREIGDRTRLGRVSSFQATHAWLRGRHVQAVEYSHQALDIASELGDLALAVRTNLILGEASHALGRYREAIEVLGRNVAVLQGDLETRRVGLVGLPSVLSRVWIGWSLTELGDFAAAGPMGDEAVRIAERVDHPYSRIIAYFGVGGVHLRRGQLEPATVMLERALDLCRVWDTQLRQLFLGVAPSVGHARALAGRLPEAIALLEESVQDSAAAGMLYGQALRLSWLADAYRRAGRIADARRVVQQALDLARDQGERGHEVWALGVLAEISVEAELEAVDEAEAIYREILAAAEALGMRPRLAVAHLGLGRLYRRAGRRSEATHHLAVALDLFRAMEMPLGLAQAEAEQTTFGVR